MTTTPTNLAAPRQVSSSASGAPAPSCWCGQDLADVHRDHQKGQDYVESIESIIGQERVLNLSFDSRSGQLLSLIHI